MISSNHHQQPLSMASSLYFLLCVLSNLFVARSNCDLLFFIKVAKTVLKLFFFCNQPRALDMDYKKTVVKKQAKVQTSKKTAETRYWKRFKVKIVLFFHIK